VIEMPPKTEESPVVRTAFDDEDAWRTVCEMIRRPVDSGFGEEFSAHVEFIDNPASRGP